MSYSPLQRSGDGYVSYCEPGASSPVFVIAFAAISLIEDGKAVKLPQYYNLQVLDHITYLTGRFGQYTQVSSRQLQEIVAIGHELLENFSDELTPAQKAAIKSITG